MNKIKKILDKIKDILKCDDSHEFKPLLSEIEDSPASPLGLFMFWTIVAFIVFTGLWLFFGKVDVVITARGMIIPDGEVKIIQPLDTGVIRKILVKEGDFVQKDDILMEIDPSTTEPALASKEENLKNIELEKQENKFSWQEEMEQYVYKTIEPGKEISRAYRYLRKRHTRLSIIYLNHLQKKYPNWSEIYFAKAIGFYATNKFEAMMNALKTSCTLGNREACEDFEGFTKHSKSIKIGTE